MEDPILTELKRIIELGINGMTDGDKTFLIARRSYLTSEQYRMFQDILPPLTPVEKVAEALQGTEKKDETVAPSNPPPDAPSTEQPTQTVSEHEVQTEPVQNEPAQPTAQAEGSAEPTGASPENTPTQPVENTVEDHSKDPDYKPE